MDLEHNKIYENGDVVLAAKARKKARSPYARRIRSDEPERKRFEPELKKKILQYFESGRYSISEIAIACGISYSAARRFLDRDPELREKWETAFNKKLDEVVEAMTDRAIAGRNEIAAQQAGEFLLRHHRRDTYTEKAGLADAAKSLPKIIVPLIINRGPENVLPSANSIQHQEAIDV